MNTSTPPTAGASRQKKNDHPRVHRDPQGNGVIINASAVGYIHAAKPQLIAGKEVPFCNVVTAAGAVMVEGELADLAERFDLV